MNGIRKFDITYRGDPDLQPIRSFECAALVRMLYNMSKVINNKVPDPILNCITSVAKYLFVGLDYQAYHNVLNLCPRRALHFLKTGVN